MWQRKQTIYLIALLFLTAIVLQSDINAAVAKSLPGCVLAAIDCVVAVAAVVAIAGFKCRKRQMRICRFIELMLVGWLLYFAYDHYVVCGGAVRYPLYAMLPAVGVVVAEMARRGVRRDDELVRSADRLR